MTKDQIETLEKFIRAVIADTALHSGDYESIVLMNARDDLVQSFKESKE